MDNTNVNGTNRMQGVIVSYDSAKAYGFVEPVETGLSRSPQHFFHLSFCVSGYRPKIGDLVAFTSGINPRNAKPVATQVVLVAAAAPEPAPVAPQSWEQDTQIPHTSRLGTPKDELAGLGSGLGAPLSTILR